MSLFTDLPFAPHVWIGCLACYNEGSLVGDWYAAVDAAEVSPESLHGLSTSHEELWVMDHEGLPVNGEMSPEHATRWAERLGEAPEHLRAPFCAWVADGDHIEDAEGLPCLDDFEESFCGEWESFAEYAGHLADEIGLLDGVPEEVARYFHWDAWAHDLAFDYSVAEAPGGSVYVFRSL